MAKIINGLLTLSMVAALATVSLAQTQTAPEAAKVDKAKVLAMLQGAWVFTSVDGEELPPNGPEVVVTITDQKYVQVTNGAIVERGTFTFDETKKPMTMNLVIVEGDSAGQTQLGVFEVTGNTMKGKLSDAGVTVRPTDFTPSDGTFVFTAKKR